MKRNVGITHKVKKGILLCKIKDVYKRQVLNQENLIEECADLLCSLITKPHFVNGCFEESEVEIERQNLIDMIESKINDKRFYAIDRCEEFMYEKEPYGIDEYGTVEAARAITAQSASDAYHDLMEHADIQIMFTGHGDYKKIKSVFEQAFSNVKREPTSQPIVPRITGAQKVKEHIERLDFSGSRRPPLSSSTSISTADTTSPWGLRGMVSKDVYKRQHPQGRAV